MSDVSSTTQELPDAVFVEDADPGILEDERSLTFRYQSSWTVTIGSRESARVACR